VGQQEGQDGLALGRLEPGQAQRGRTDEQPLAAGVPVGPDHRVLDGLGQRRAGAAAVVVLGVPIVDRADRLQQILERFGQAVVGGLQVGPQRVAADLRDHLVGERLDAERGSPPQPANVPVGRRPSLLEVVDVDQAVVRVAMGGGRVVEWFVEDPHRLHLLVRG